MSGSKRSYPQNPEYIVSISGDVYLARTLEKLTPIKCQGEYLYVKLCDGSKEYHKPVHLMVAEAWLENPHQYTQVKHRDHDRSNNGAFNLFWCRN